MPKNKQITRSAPAKTLKIVNKTQNSETVNGDNKLNKTPTKNGSYKDSVFATQPRNSSGNSNTTLRRSSRRFGRPNVNPENNTNSDKDVQPNQIDENDDNAIENEEDNEVENNEASVNSPSQEENETGSTQSQEVHTANSSDRPRRSSRFSQSNVNPYDRVIESIASKPTKSSKSKKVNNKDTNTTEGSESNEAEVDTNQTGTEDGNASPEEDHLDGELDFGNDEEEIESSDATINENEAVDSPTQETNNTAAKSTTTINKTKKSYISKNVPRWAKATNGETVSWESQETETSEDNQTNKQNNNNVTVAQTDDAEEEHASETPGSPIIGQINAFEHLLDFDPSIWSQDQVDYLKKLCLKTKFDRELIFKKLDSLKVNPLEQFLKNDIKLKINELVEDILNVYLNQINHETTKAAIHANAVNNQNPTTEEQDVVNEDENLSRPNSTTPRTPEHDDQESVYDEETAHNTNNASPQTYTTRSGQIRSRSRASSQSDTDTEYDSDTNTIVAIVPSKKKQKPTAKKFWTEAENAALEQGILKHGCNWRLILDNNITKGDKSLINRTNINLKDRARSEKARRMKSGLDLGVYENLILNVDSLLPKHLKEYN